MSISENSKWSVPRRFQNGTFIIVYPPYGYDNDNGTMVIVPEQAEIVKEIFAACLAQYQNRYCFSGKIKCGECGTNFKRRQHYKPSGNYVAWTCGKHLEDKKDCSMLYMLLRTLRGMDDKDKLLRNQEVDICIESNTDRKQILTSMMATGVLEPTVFNQENAALAMEEQKLRAEREKLVNFVGGDKTRIKELQRLMVFTSKGVMLTAFEDETFLAYVES